MVRINSAVTKADKHWSLGWSEKNFFGNSKKCSLEILANDLKIEKNRLEPVATYHGLATPPKIGRGGKMAIKSCYFITASRRDLIYSSKLQNHHVSMSAKRTFLSISIIKKVSQETGFSC